MATRRSARVRGVPAASGQVPNELKIAGTSTLGGSQRLRLATGTVKNVKGFRYVSSDSEDEPEMPVAVSKAPPRKRRRATPSEPKDDDRDDDDDDEPELARKRPGKAAAVTASKKVKRPARRAHLPNQQFLERAQQQLSEPEVKEKKTIETMLDLLARVKEPTADHVQQQDDESSDYVTSAIDAWILTSADARQLLASNTALNAPVFVANGANTAQVLDANSNTRPIEQILPWFRVPDEQYGGTYEVVQLDELRDYEGRARTGEDEHPNAQDLKSRFLDNENGYVIGEPWKFADLPTPLLSHCAPSFLNSHECSVLRDVMRWLLNFEADDICHSDCTGMTVGRDCKDAHHLSIDEVAVLNYGWRQWQGTIMLAEAGACALPHLDRRGFGTWISCIEGEMGFIWPSRPTEKDRLAVLTSPEEDLLDKIGDRWRYTVLRPGDTLYMPPSMPHAVFRLPHGGQTMGMAGHVVRRCEVSAWMKALQRESKRPGMDKESRHTLLGLLAGIKFYAKDVVETDERAYGDVGVAKKLVAMAKESETRVRHRERAVSGTGK